MSDEITECQPLPGASGATTFQEALYLEALTRVPGLGRQTLFKLLQKAGSPTALWETDDAFLQAHLSARVKEAFLSARDQGCKPEWLESALQLGVQVVACTDPRFPRLLREIHNPPAFLYVQGNLDALTGKTVAVVGTRKSTEYGRQVAQRLIGELSAAGVAIISGLAAGIDTDAHWAALQNGLPTAAVFGCGLDMVYPATNRKLSREIVAQGGALVSEYPMGMSPTRFSFPQRNRIVAGLSYGLLVIEGDLKSGALITARLALEEGRTVFAVPGNIFSPNSQGPLSLIKNGAVTVSCAEDMLKELQWWLETGQTHQLSLEMNKSVTLKPGTMPILQIPEHVSGDERLVLQAIAYDPISVDDLQQTTGLPSAKINGCLTLLELDGLIVLLPGAKVCRKSTC